MGTRAIYTFTDESGSFNVYKHYDGYPSGAASAIELATKRAWELPRFEADEFAASFVAANKTGSGDVRLLESGKPIDVAPGDIEYRYEITSDKGKLYVKAFSTDYPWDGGLRAENHETSIFSGTFAQFKSKFARKAKAA